MKKIVFVPFPLSKVKLSSDDSLNEMFLENIEESRKENNETIESCSETKIMEDAEF